MCVGARVYANKIGIKIDKLRGGELNLCAGNILLDTHEYENGVLFVMVS